MNFLTWLLAAGLRLSGGAVNTSKTGPSLHPRFRLLKCALKYTKYFFLHMCAVDTWEGQDVCNDVST